MAKDLYIPREDWFEVVPIAGNRVYFDHPIFGFGWRDSDNYLPILTTCSGVAFNPGGIDNLSYDLRNDIFKVDWRRVEQQKERGFVTLEHVPVCGEYRNFHHVSLQGVLERYFDLPMEVKVVLECGFGRI